METLTFKLSGNTAFFKQPDVNTYLYYTYGNIHKIALLGLFGSILGLNGYNQQKKNEDYPEFYQKLKTLKIAICPLNDQGYIPKKVQVFNNSVGYYNKDKQDKPCNLIVKEQWLEKPVWQIYLLLDGLNESLLLQSLKKRMVEKRFVYLPYLGKNDHYANIEAIAVHPIIRTMTETPIIIDSFFPKKTGELIPKRGLGKKEPDFKYEERLPIALESVCNQYVTESLIFTNIPVKLNQDFPVYEVNGKNLMYL
ncbi:type I-B CRISPR-associated protein Cas5b [Acetobacterium tundrae]|uniref:Type I-B CRISPR-associated protein Cas5 n=1 Tax=Acetobacterium tundrae TaxID=132932 RepID=A0ABR6WPI4_9FIRM|nr:type I-B CRISPR-associated protein Cas5b [Acetobacterium tundrae]MBC3798259.1 type I-B CRISPR-associated protein Cas5 [Acetobacterium tundrae]